MKYPCDPSSLGLDRQTWDSWDLGLDTWDLGQLGTDRQTDIVWVVDDEIVEIAMSPSFSSLVAILNINEMLLEMN